MRRGDVNKNLFTKKMLLKMSSFQIQSFMSSYRKISDISKKVFIKNGYRYIFTLINKFILKYPPKKNIEVTVYPHIPRFSTIAGNQGWLIYDCDVAFHRNHSR